MATNIHNIYLGQKFSPCQQRIDLILREDLIDDLNSALEGNITLLSSPAGFGKSCLLAQFYHRLQSSSHITPIWLSLDAKDNEPNHFYSLVASALVSHNIVDDSLVSAANNASAEHQEEQIAIQIIKALANHNKRLLLILDDFHFVTHQRILDFIIHLLDFHLPNFHLVISTRVTPKLPLSHFATQGLLTIINAESLRFSEMNSHELLKTVVPKNQISKLIAKAEGWPVALQLIKLWYQQHSKKHNTKLMLTGDGQIAAYMTEQIVEYLDADVRRFLLETSVLDRFNESLADTIRKESDSSRLISSLTNLDALIVPIDVQGNWFRYHHLISDYLRIQLTSRLSLTEIKLLHERASIWYSQNDILSDAILHAQKSDNLSLAVEHVFKFGGWQMILTKGIGFVESVLHYFSDTEIKNHSVLALMSCYLNLKLGNVRLARELLELAKCLEYQQLAKNIDKQRLIILEQIVILYEDTPDIHTIQTIYKELAKNDFLAKGILEAGLALTQIQQGEFTSAKQFAVDGFVSMKNAGCLVGATYLLFHKGQSIAYSGQIEKAKSVFLEAQVYAKSQLVYDSGLETITNCVLANMYFELGEFEDARKLLDSSFRNIETRDSWFDIFANTFRTATLLSLKDKTYGKALELLNRAVRVANERNIVKLKQLADIWKIKYLFLSDKHSEANSQINLVQSQLFCNNEKLSVNWFSHKEFHSIMCEYYLRKNSGQKCLYHASELSKIAGNLKQDLELARASLYRCLVYFSENKEDKWKNEFEYSLSFAAKDKLVSLFTEMPHGLESVIKKWIRLHEKHNLIFHANYVLSMINKESKIISKKTNLSHRESQILDLLSKGFQNKQIASQLNISENTVKFHLKNLFVKLNVNNRLEAITKFMNDLG